MGCCGLGTRFGQQEVLVDVGAGCAGGNALGEEGGINVGWWRLGTGLGEIDVGRRG